MSCNGIASDITGRRNFEYVMPSDGITNSPRNLIYHLFRPDGMLQSAAGTALGLQTYVRDSVLCKTWMVGILPGLGNFLATTTGKSDHQNCQKNRWLKQFPAKIPSFKKMA